MDDISSRSRIEEHTYKNASLFELLENHAKITIVKIDAHLRAEYVSPSMLKILGYAPEYFLGNSVMDVVHEEDRPGLEAQIAETIRSRAEILEREYRVRTISGRITWMETKARLFYDERGEFDGALYIQSDISDRKLQESQLKLALKEKDYLMRELSHRVKNNLAMVSSLISLKNSEIEADLSDLIHRIDIVELVHEKLHMNGNIESIAAREYFQELLEAIFYSSSIREVTIVNRVQAVEIPLHTAIPLALVINELAMNAVQHGFTHTEKAVFTLEMKRDSQHGSYILKVTNTGRPFPGDIKLATSETLGLQLITVLVQQIQGTIELQKEPFPRFTIRFPHTARRMVHG